MMFRVVLLSVVALVQGAVYPVDPLHETMVNAVTLMNAMYFGQSSIQFPIDFGIGVPLLNGKAQVQIFPPFQFFQNSTSEQFDSLTEICTFRVKIELIKISKNTNIDEDLCLPHCNLELTYVRSDKGTLRQLNPSSAWLDACTPILCNNRTALLHGEQVLPLLAETFIRMTTGTLSYASSVNPQRDETLIWNTFKNLFISQMFL